MRKILVVDDDEAILEAFQLTLESWDYSVKTASKYDDIIKVLDNDKPDLIILDVLLSGQDGRDICRKLKENEKYRKTPIIMVSAHPDAKENSLDAGADDFLPKPFDIDVLLKKIKKFVS
jgi:DNA-binding response OmpR family regulator